MPLSQQWVDAFKQVSNMGKDMEVKRFVKVGGRDALQVPACSVQIVMAT